MKKIAILGSTGSIGVSALEVIGANPDHYEVTALTAAKNVDLLLEQIKRFTPRAVSVLEAPIAAELKKRLNGHTALTILYGQDGYKQIASMEEVDTVISAMTGAAGLIPTHEAIQSGKAIALANKETLVMAGPLIMNAAKEKGVPIYPVDSEHSAIFQSLRGHSKEDVNRIILTASGGPFRESTLERMKTVTATEALKHPNWDMGPKITIDSASMMNKGLEVIEAKWLFDLSIDQIGILIHPESILHSMVEYRDGSVIAQLGIPDMKIPIAYALSYPRHLENGLTPLDLAKVGNLTFQEPDLKRFKCLDLALQAAEEGGSMPAVLNAANEVAVEAFLKGRIGFLDIPSFIEKSMMAHTTHSLDHIERIIETDRWARETTGLLIDDG
ncbi:MAG: 1-deoxy-D-xylulose-5-phosphate reductoisomerase [Deltaproteobacteria bacterium]|nr:1-deoxy-D-xylulose-5-phosphate reductoisomerase [Deltaproteobacteria bacterium]